jgi:hypothetical protein
VPSWSDVTPRRVLGERANPRQRLRAIRRAPLSLRHAPGRCFQAGFVAGEVVIEHSRLAYKVRGGAESVLFPNPDDSFAEVESEYRIENR